VTSTKGGARVNRKPTGKEIITLMITLLAKQEGVKVDYIEFLNEEDEKEDQ
jgi:hypothetical protein